MNPLWSFVLTGIGVSGLYLVTNRHWYGFMIGVGVQVLWVVYAVSTTQWGFIISAAAYGYVNVRGWCKWQSEQALHSGQVSPGISEGKDSSTT